MQISYNWLKNYLNIDIEVDKVSEILTDIGLEVGGVEEVQSVKGGLEGLVIGEVLTCERHPNADKLSKTTVNVGGDEILPVVCGAPNVAAGQKVVVATVGAVLYDGDESFTIKKSKIRGEESQGMICAEDEIGLGKSHDGIMVLPADVAVGTPAKEYFKVESDVVFEVDLTPNRVDSASHYGVARDLAAYLKSNGKEANLQLPSIEDFKVDNNDFPVEIVVENEEACPRYCGVTISGVTVQDSPDWLKNKLKLIGLSPINNVVDVTNFVLHELGQPLHAFDGDEIKGNKVVVKTLAEKSKFTTLDEIERELSDKDLMICNAEEGMCIAGVFGGMKSGVKASTTKVFLESAYFNPVFVRKTAKRHTLSTDASFRFERGIDPNITVFALKRAASLIKKVAGGTISSEITDIYPNPIANFEVDVKWKNILRLIGKDLSKETIKTIVTSLEMEILNEDEVGMKLSIPPYRVDVQREIDVIEDILRIYGYNNIEIPEAVHSTLVYSDKPDDHKVKNIIANQLVSQGFSEIMCNSLTKPGFYSNLTKYPENNVVAIFNPLSNDLGGMRQSLVMGGLESIVHNVNRRSADLKLFEFGNCYSLNNPEGEKGSLDKYSEHHSLGVFLTGNMITANWNAQERKVSFADMRAVVNQIILRLNIPEAMLAETDVENDVFIEGVSLATKNKIHLVDFGIVSPELSKIFGLKETVYFAEFNWNNLLKVAGKQTVIYKEIPKYPEVSRDLALLVDKNVTFGQIKEVALKTEKKLLKSVSLFDIYEGEKLGADKKSYAVNFILQDENKTLTDKQIDKIMSNMVKNLEREVNASLR
ncbi:phenylalanine--tRNA ligase subunit beta [Plebeiibacterium sediminum]|uniref:Phenylalanine--tRNA ligase beta subunit n=1 Tax=Plebeiibacterium sediminum TaxID=2992112 RepID=A0AAE3M6K7_9BACT|nr:phenylalanine--tRNA ligase subunit beta [Plebeiobacterium sediminum]MCW3787790.1 phenylalanine--tRNA ligase subunit beta [Plebeiobacterium sediminum]